MARIRDSEEFEKEVFDVVRKSEESVLGAGRKWAKAVGDAMPIEMPVVREVVKGAFDFTEEILKIQREFAYTMLRATTTSPAGREAPHRATRTAPTHATHRAPRTAATRKAA